MSCASAANAGGGKNKEEHALVADMHRIPLLSRHLHYDASQPRHPPRTLRL